MVSELQHWRNSAGWSRTTLAEKSGISVSTIARIESPDYEFKTHVDVANLLADALNCTVNDLFDPEELSTNGRNPLTGRPVTRKPHHAIRVMTCPECFLEVPEAVGCFDCGVPARAPSSLI